MTAIDSIIVAVSAFIFGYCAARAIRDTRRWARTPSRTTVIDRWAQELRDESDRLFRVAVLSWLRATVAAVWLVAMNVAAHR